MSANKPLYDLVLMLDTSADDARRKEIVASAEETIAAGGEVVNKQDWGPRQMTFEIRHKKDADYHLLQFHATPDVLERLDRQLRIVDEVVRYRIVKLAPGTPPPVEQRPEPRPTSSTVNTDDAAPSADADNPDEPAAADAPETDPVAAEAPAAEPVAMPAE
jgi:small subunit ribosomal protein S6